PLMPDLSWVTWSPTRGRAAHSSSMLGLSCPPGTRLIRVNFIIVSLSIRSWGKGELRIAVVPVPMVFSANPSHRSVNVYRAKAGVSPQRVFDGRQACISIVPNDVLGTDQRSKL